ncbi:MAG: DUF4276 family protein [Mariprofundaceae bacterium]|nr:DUF4276 family protein [Mariprofundaceae bacterium]
MSIYLYVEGGAKGSLARECRKGFSQFLNKAGLAGRMPKVFACGSRRAAYEDFCTAIQNGKAAVLLVDSEAPVEASSDKAKPWQHVKDRQGDGWERPAGVTDEDLHFMVHCMEAWFLADKGALSSYFGQNFQVNSLPKRGDIEKVDKADIYRGLSQATKETQKGEYGKGKHSFKILALIAPDKVRSASPYADRFLKVLGC